MTDGIIQEAFNDLLDTINDEHLTNGFYTGNVKNGKPKKRDIVVSLSEVNGRILEAKQELIEKIKQIEPEIKMVKSYVGKDILTCDLIDRSKLIGDNQE